MLLLNPLGRLPNLSSELTLIWIDHCGHLEEAETAYEVRLKEE